MFVDFIENASRFLVLESIRDEALGDLWELDTQLSQAGTSRFIRAFRCCQYFCSMVKASIIIFVDENFLGSSQDRDDLWSKGEDQYDGTNLTVDEIRAVRQHCNVRRLNGSVFGDRSISLAGGQNSYWIQQADRIIERCWDRGEEAIDCEAIVNSFVLSSAIRRLETVPPNNVNIDSLSSLVKEIELTDDFIDRYVEFSSKIYRRQLICRTWSLAVYVISWMPGQESWMHHHGYALDVIKVIRGKMTHSMLSPEQWEGYVPFEGFEKSRRYEGPSQVFSEGDVVSIDRRHGHQVGNLSDENLVTLHFRFGHPPEDKHWRSTNDTEMFIWNQTEGCFDLVRPFRGRYASTF